MIYSYLVQFILYALCTLVQLLYIRFQFGSMKIHQISTRIARNKMQYCAKNLHISIETLGTGSVHWYIKLTQKILLTASQVQAEKSMEKTMFH